MNMMSSTSTRSRPNRRNRSLHSDDGMSRNSSRMRPKPVSYSDAYTFALRVAYLHHLLQKRPKGKQFIIPSKPISKKIVSIADLVQDFSRTRDSNKIKFPVGFMSLLEQRIQDVILGKENIPKHEYSAIKRIFAEAYTAFSEQGFRKRMEKERRVEDLVLIFYSNAIKSLQKTATEEDSVKMLVDRHVALFVQFISMTLRIHGYDKGRAELMAKLANLESKLLTNDNNLFADTSSSATHGAEGDPQISYDVKDMAMVQVVTKIFGLKNSQVQTDIDNHRSVWTLEAALADLKAYQHCLHSNSRRTLRSEDFDLDEGYHAWLKAEGPEIYKLTAEILRVRPDLSSSSGLNQALPLVRTSTPNTDDQTYSDIARTLTNQSDSNSSLIVDQPFDMSALMLDDENSGQISLEEASYTFIPHDSRGFFRTILAHTMTYDQLHRIEATEELELTPLLSRDSIDFLTELSIRWRIPQFSRLVLFLDVAAQKFLDQELELEELDSAFDFAKNPPPEIKRFATGLLSCDQTLWTIRDFALYRQILTNLNDGLSRDLYELLQHCYDAKPPSTGPVLLVLESHLYGDPRSSLCEEDRNAYKIQIEEGLRAKAASVYRGYLEAEVPDRPEDWKFSHIVNLGKSVVKLRGRTQKRNKENPEIMGVNPLNILVETMFPSFETDAGHLIQRILQMAEERNSEVDLDDGFALYKELVKIRQIHHAALPEQPFAFDIEELLEQFVWRWIYLTDSKMIELVDQAMKHDDFQIKSPNPAHSVVDDRRHSNSIVDVFSLFNETANQIFQLNWDNDVQYARFMTALAKSFGTGISRYCERIEHLFSKEMDRLSPSQESVSLQSKQEKWMQLAKNAWNHQEKIEPFQFYPESLVKLNNIEFAIQQLDILQKTMNVDACAEVLAKIESRNDLKQKPVKYVFTIKIVEAEDIKACDNNGTSDPYVVLGDEFQNRLAKTRVVTKTIYPRWDESIDIIVQGPLNIIATIWDWDAFGDHDYIGRTSLKLDPIHFSDYLPQEYWLNLDTQGRLLLRVSMEGEKDGIQFYLAKSFRLLKRTERDMTRMITDKLSQYINTCLSQEALRQLLSRGISVAAVTNLWKNLQTVSPPVTQIDIENAMKPLLIYFDENFAIMKETLTEESMVMVMTRLWKEVLLALECLLVPPLSDKPSTKKPLNQQEMDIVFKWLELLFEFFHARDDQTGEAMGIPVNVLKSSKYHELASLNFFYFDTTDNLIRISERMATVSAQRATQHRSRLSAPLILGSSFSGFLGATSIRRSKSIMMSRNLGTMKKAKEEKRKEAQADPSDDMILRILRMRPEAAPYLRDRSRQKERLAAAAAADKIVKQSLAASGNKFGTTTLARR